MIEFCSRGIPVSSSMQSESADPEQSPLIPLKCAGCLQYIRPPIHLCDKGHKICNNCRKGHTYCSACSNFFVSFRNLVLEDRARQAMYPCKYGSNGCTESFSHDKIHGHEATCRYIPRQCPFRALASQYCRWTCSYSDIKVHLKENHFEECCEYVEADFKFLYNLTAGMKFFRFIFAHNEVFFSLFEEKSNIFYAVVLCVGPAENAAKYKYRVEFINKDDTEGVTVMHLTRSSDEYLDNVYSSGTCGKLHYDVVSRLKDEEDNVKFKLEIISVGN